MQRELHARPTAKRGFLYAGEHNGSDSGILIEATQYPCQLVYEMLRQGISFHWAVQLDHRHTRFPDRQLNGRRLSCFRFHGRLLHT